MARDDRGQASLVALLWLGAGVVLAFGMVRVGRAAIDSARASSAADAAALAAAAAPDSDAFTIAAHNDAEIVSIERFGSEVRVRVRVGEAERSARAERRLVRMTAGDAGRPLVVETIEYTARRDRDRRPGGQRVPRRDALDGVRRSPRRILRHRVRGAG